MVLATLATLVVVIFLGGVLPPAARVGDVLGAKYAS